LLVCGFLPVLQRLRRKLMRLAGVFLRLLRQLMRAQMIAPAMCGRGSLMGMRCLIVELCGSVVRALRHRKVLLSALDAETASPAHPSSLQARIVPHLLKTRTVICEFVKNKVGKGVLFFDAEKVAV
jgi:hypothetical protein